MISCFLKRLWLLLLVVVAVTTFFVFGQANLAAGNTALTTDILAPAVKLNKNTIFQTQHFTNHDSILVLDHEGKRLFDWQSDQPRVPASLMKVLTAWLAIDRWGEDHRFSTEFYLHNGVLWVRGLGDPYLVSEELDVIVPILKLKLQNSKSPQIITGLGLDASLFVDELAPGNGKTNDPYNAPLSALSVNFNTVSVKRRNGQLLSGEKQTPLTPLARNLANNIHWRDSQSEKPERINLGNASAVRQQFAQILSMKLGLSLDYPKPSIVNHGIVPIEAKLLYRHSNTHSLGTIVRGALKYSNNFIANQLFLLLGQKNDSGPLTFVKSVHYSKDRLSAVDKALLSNLSSISIVEGAGLSRNNQLTANQLLEVLHLFEPYQGLLKVYQLNNTHFARAKSGTLKGVHTLAGYLHIDDRVFKFVFLFNRGMPYKYREKLLQQLATELTSYLEGLNQQ